MAVACTNIIGNTSGSGTSATTASITATANRLYLLTVWTRTGITANPNQPTASGGGLGTWDVIASVVYDDSSSSRKRVTLFRALSASPGAGAAIAIDEAGQTQTSFGWIVDEVTGIDTSGTNGSGAIVQSATNIDSSATTASLTVTLAAFGSANNATYGSFAEGGNGTWTQGSGFTKIGNVTTTGDTMNGITEFLASNDTTVDATDSTNSELGGIGIEIKAATTTNTANFFAFFRP